MAFIFDDTEKKRRTVADLDIDEPTPNIVVDNQQPAVVVKRGRGRAPGVKNKVVTPVVSASSDLNTSLASAQVDTQSSVPVVKRGRGRPPGVKNKVVALVSQPDSTASVSSSDPTPIKRGRGRPPGVKNKVVSPASQSAPSASVASNDLPVVKRGRGRPPGSKNKVVALVSRPDSSISVANSDVTIPKRGRGRPPGSKNKTTEQPVVHETLPVVRSTPADVVTPAHVQHESTTPLIKRGRGRPPGAKNAQPSESLIASVLASEPQPKRGRGRPPGVKHTQSTEPLITAVLNSEPQPKRGRGRPPGAKNKVSSTVITQAPEIKRKRGRPPIKKTVQLQKLLQDAVRAPVVAEADRTGVLPVKRKRGRPPGVKNKLSPMIGQPTSEVVTTTVATTTPVGQPVAEQPVITKRPRGRPRKVFDATELTPVSTVAQPLPANEHLSSPVVLEAKKTQPAVVSSPADVLDPIADELVNTPQAHEVAAIDQAEWSTPSVPVLPAEVLEPIAVIEGALYVAGKDGMTPAELHKIIPQLTTDEIIRALRALQNKLDIDCSTGLTVKRFGDKYRLLTKAEVRAAVSRYANTKFKNPLGAKLMETLAIIAYNQPCTRPRISEIRGVDSAALVDVLIGHGLVAELGRIDTPGRPFIYGVTDKFFDMFGVSKLEDLPAVKKFDAEAFQEGNFFDVGRQDD